MRMRLAKRRYWFLLLISSAVFVWPALSLAAVFSQGYPASEDVSPGMLLSIEGGTVKPATVEDVENLFGVAVDQPDTAVAVTTNADQEVQVVTNGRVAVLVSDINGEIKAGDLITASPLAGIGMKLGADISQKIIGTAQADASGSVTEQVPGANGGREVKISRIPVLVAVSLSTRSSPLAILQQAGATVAGKTVSPTKALLAALLLIVAILSVSVLLYTSVRSSLISIGRNPLSQSAVRRELLRVLLTVPLILGAALTLIYVILRG